MLNSTVKFKFSLLDREPPFWANLFQNIKLKSDTVINLNILYSMVIFTLEQLYPFRVDLVQKNNNCLFKAKFST